MPNNLKFWRERKGISQAELARAVGVSRQALSAVEAHKQDPSLGLAMKLASVLDLSPQQLFFANEEEESMNVKTVTLTKQERVALANQYRILADVHKDDEHMKLHYERREEIVLRGYEYLYDEIFRELWKEMPEEDSEEVISILSLHRALRDALGSSPDPKDLERVKFLGFDGNNESEYLSFAKFFTADGERFSELKVVNSHHSTLSRYRLMLAEWKRLGGSFMLDKAQAERILEAGTFHH